MRLGILSDTHGSLRPEVLERLAGSDHILHAGDVGEISILDRLRTLAPVSAIRGNTDPLTLFASLPLFLSLDIDGIAVRVIHRREDIDPAWPREARLIVFGHSHRPELEWRGDCLLLNPGACGARRFRLPLTVAIVTLTEGRLVPEVLSVEPSDLLDTV